MFGFQSSSVYGPLKKRKKGMKLIKSVALTGSNLEILINTDTLYLPQGISPLFPFLVVD